MMEFHYHFFKADVGYHFFKTDMQGEKTEFQFYLTEATLSRHAKD